MFRIFSHGEILTVSGVHRSMLADRGRQFVGRHKWPLDLIEAKYEMDEFDDERITYCVIEEEGEHLASLRLRSAETGSMAEKYFPSLWGDLGPRLRAQVEVTRFCAKPALSSERRLAAVSDLLLGLCRHCQQSEIPSFFGVVFPAAARVLNQAGWTAHILKQTYDARGSLLLAEWKVSEFVAWRIQEKREIREERLRRHDALKPALQLVA
jgi:acyl-homoserine lactone synthase